ncbi:MAG TPA: type II CAAX endopeptidase family protein [Candidatus Saccharimonadales bacterium]|nr:type II CAAX endopeptidase family protein [Candidatus Saccharimonadales bacterium]
MVAASAEAPRPPSTIRRLRSVPWRGRDALIAFLVPWVVLPIAVVLLLQLVAPEVPGVSAYLRALNQNSPGASFGLVIVDAVGSFVAIGYYLRKYGASLRDLGIRRFNPWRVLLYLVVILAVFGLVVGAAYWLIQLIDPSFNAAQPQTNQFTGSRFSDLSLWALVIIPPFVEESVFRGFMFPAFSKRYGVVIGAVITSVLFGFAHLQGNVSVYTFILSLVLCGLYVRTNSIIPGIALHMLNNYVAYIAMLQK